MASQVELREREMDTPTNIIPDNIFFVWLGTSIPDYAAFKNRFCKETNCDQSLWSMLKDGSELAVFIQKLSPPNKFILVASGTLAENVMSTIHQLQQLHSVYIFCRDIPKHKEWSKSYVKVRNVLDNSQLLLASIRTDLGVDTVAPIVRKLEQPIPTLAQLGKL
jgi:hypothetical protein